MKPFLVKQNGNRRINNNNNRFTLNAEVLMCWLKNLLLICYIFFSALRKFDDDEIKYVCAYNLLVNINSVLQLFKSHR